jgi:hypothetical protein
MRWTERDLARGEPVGAARESHYIYAPYAREGASGAPFSPVALGRHKTLTLPEP